MLRTATTWVTTIALTAALAVPAFAAKEDETTEDHTGAQWAAAAVATPGTSGPVVGPSLLVSEVGFRGINTATVGDSTEFVEIVNPTGVTVDLSNVYLSDINTYFTLPVAGNIDINGLGTDFAFKFPAGSSIGPGAVKVVAVEGARFKRGTGLDADFMMFNSGGAVGVTTAVPMVDVMTDKPGVYPQFGMFTNGAEHIWLFYWDGGDLVCDLDLVYWGAPAGGNAPIRKLATDCQDGPDAGTGTTCYNTDAGNAPGSFTKGHSVPANGAGTRQRVAEGAEASGGNSCITTDPTPADVSTWGRVKAIYR